MKAKYSWLIYSCLIFISGNLCDRNLERRPAVSSCSVNTDDKFHCSNGRCIEWSWVCDGRKDCPDGSDETKELCARYDYGYTHFFKNCGLANFKEDILVLVNGKQKLFATPSWFVEIYKRNPKNINVYNLLCGGSIIASNVVISAASCFWTKDMLSKQISINDDLYKIIVPNNYNNIGHKMHVETIYLKEDYNDIDGLYAEDIAVIVLTEKLSFSNGVFPVCIDWYNKYDVKNGDEGTVVVHASEMENDEKVSIGTVVLYIDSSTCHNKYLPDDFHHFVTSDKFCAETELVLQNVGNDGTGIYMIHFNSYYLQGVLSVKAFLKNNTVIGYTNIKKNVPWLRGILNKHFTETTCVLPTVDGVVYSYEGSDDILSHGALINHNLTIIENCEVGYHKAYTNSSRFCLGKGKWLTNFEKLCFKMCPPLDSNSLDIKCSHNGKYTGNCSNLSIPDTIATPSCKSTYTTSNGQDNTPLELICQSNGTWNKQLYKCDPYCGRVYIINQILINNGEEALVGTAPWNVGVYKLNKTTFNYNLICGGSIVSPNLVVSAAHCFWQKGMLSNRISINDGLYKIAVGKYARDFSIIDNDFTQIINVDIVNLKEGYYGPTGFHAEDIAIIVLQNRISFSNGVAPVCIDWNSIYNVSNGDQGKIVGWGKTEEGISNPTLLEASLPYIDHSSCRNMYTNGFESFVTFDKFCAGSALVSGQGVGTGDSGAGLSFLHSNSYYLTGVVSIKDPNTKNSIAVFTEVKYHIQWIRELYRKYNYVP
ncbi:unnamed protein product [Macrosiphum euphorbiae]|uniref:Uncharacterized protein n=1 Tax=Macrosiphum euphorbiae TaxID=13131 RepID=A0AAV0VTX4_9HEMI|nr:unnamed protein product [Macrosiphum euphorbiae]